MVPDEGEQDLQPELATYCVREAMNHYEVTYWHTGDEHQIKIGWYIKIMANELMILRGKIWVKFETQNLFLYFCCDYYMYWSVANVNSEVRLEIVILGLFVEEICPFRINDVICFV